MASCRTINGVVYDLKATDRKAPCVRRAAPKSKPPKPKPKPFPVKRAPKLRPLPAPMDPSSARVGDRVSVFQYGSGEPAHATLTELPGTMRVAAKWGGRESTEPTLHFVNGESAGMNRYVRWERVFPGWLERDGWQPWKG